MMVNKSVCMLTGGEKKNKSLIENHLEIKETETSVR